MCRMIAAPMGALGSLLIDPFLRMARGENALNEHNTELGKWDHPDGWGAVTEDAGRLRVVRSTEACWDDLELERLRSQRIFLLHARKKSPGKKVELGQTHPFEHETAGASWAFCHNGTVRGIAPSGESDSREVFRRLLPHIADGRILEGILAVYGGFDDFTGVNTFLLGPEALWVVCLSSENPTYYALSLTQTEHGPIVSSEPLAELGTETTPLPNGTILRIDRRTGATQTLPFAP